MQMVICNYLISMVFFFNSMNIITQLLPHLSHLELLCLEVLQPLLRPPPPSLLPSGTSISHPTHCS